ncbi:MAG: hypothetical protein WCC66_09840 [Rhizobiaceae bacterium]
MARTSGVENVGAGFGESRQGAYQVGFSKPQDDEFSIGDLVRFLWRGRYWVIASALGLFALAGILLLVARIAVPGVNSYSTSIMTTMSGADAGKYPNGAPFSATDLRSPMVVEEVYRLNNLDKSGINLADFGGMISVEPYSPAYQSISDRYRLRLESKTITFEERKAIEEEFRQALDAVNANGVKITLAISESYGISDNLAQKIVSDVPATWAKLFIEKLGVTNLQQSVSGVDIVDPRLVGELDYPLAYDYVAKQSGILLKKLISISEIPGSETYRSTKSGKSVSDLLREAQSFEEFRLRLSLKPIVDQGLSKDPAFAALVYSNLIRSLERDVDVSTGLSSRVTQVIGDFRSKAPGTADGSGAPSGNVATQIDGAFVDRIVELSNRGSGIEFEQGLLRDKLGFENQAVQTNDQKARLNERLLALNTTTLSGISKQLLEKRFVEGMAAAVGEINALWGDASSFGDELSASRLNFDKALYRLNSLPKDVATSKKPLIDLRSALLAIAALIFGAFAGMIAYALKAQIKKEA